MGSYATMSAVDLGVLAVKELLSRANVDPSSGVIDEVLFGQVLQAGAGQNPARQVALGAGLPVSTPAATINKVCGSSLKAAMMAANSIRAGEYKAIVAGGMENMTRAPYLLPDARNGMRMGDKAVVDSMMYDGLTDAYEGNAMGVFADMIAAEYQFSREQQDAYALESIRRAKAAQDGGKFDREIAPVTVATRKGEVVIDQDEGPQNAQAEKVPGLRPAFSKEGTVTAANASSINDGASAMVLMRKSDASASGHNILAEIVAHGAHAHEPAYFTTAPVKAIEKALARAEWSTDEVDLWEINEAFAVVPMIAMKELSLDHDKVNVNGGACVLGHPIGASGARIMATLLAEMEKRDAKKGVAALCIGGGEATAICLQRD